MKIPGCFSDLSTRCFVCFLAMVECVVIAVPLVVIGNDLSAPIFVLGIVFGGASLAFLQDNYL
jgi:hypothetical protein